MHYNVHSPCAFHNRIAKSIGIFVGAALIATLGLPSAAQAQTPDAPKVTGTGDGKVPGGGAIEAPLGAAVFNGQHKNSAGRELNYCIFTRRGVTGGPFETGHGWGNVHYAHLQVH